MQYLKNILKGLISIGLLGYLIVSSEPQKIVAVLSNIYRTDGILYLSAAIGFALISLVIMTIRWKLILRNYGLEVKAKRLFGFYGIGLFFNNFLPTGIGGDIMRIYKVIGETGERTASFASVIIERIIGIAATLFLAITALFYVSHYFKDDRILYISIALLTAIVGFLVIVTREKPVTFMLNVFDKVTILKIGEKINKLIEAIHNLKSRRKIYLHTFYLSVLSQASIIMMNFMVARALNIEIDLIYLALVVPITIILTMLPSINGVGVRDGGFVFLFGQIGLSGAAALSLSFMNVIIPMFISIWGGILFLVQKKKENLKEVLEIENIY